MNEPALANWMGMQCIQIPHQTFFPSLLYFLCVGSVHPNGSLYERPLNIRAAQQEHHNFRKVLETHGCLVMTVKEILLKVILSLSSYQALKV